MIFDCSGQGIGTGRTAPGRFDAEKRKRNLADGYKETKGLRDGHCNRRACQAPLAGQRQAWMTDHETFTKDGRLYYCWPCTIEFNKIDDRNGGPRRCTPEKQYGCTPEEYEAATRGS